MLWRCVQLLAIICICLSYTQASEENVEADVNVEASSAAFAVRRISELTGVDYTLQNLVDIDVKPFIVHFPRTVPEYQPVTVEHPHTGKLMTIQQLTYVRRNVPITLDLSAQMMLDLVPSSSPSPSPSLTSFSPSTSSSSSPPSSPIRVKCTVSTDGQGFQTLTEYRVLDLPDSLPLSHPPSSSSTPASTLPSIPTASSTAASAAETNMQGKDKKEEEEHASEDDESGEIMEEGEEKVKEEEGEKRVHGEVEEEVEKEMSVALDIAMQNGWLLDAVHTVFVDPLASSSFFAAASHHQEHNHSAKSESESKKDTKARKETVSVMSVNLWNYNYWEERKNMLAQEIRRMNPDIIGFQEVRSRKHSPHAMSRNQADDLALLLPGYYFIYAPAMSFWEGNTEYVQEGLAIFSRFPISEYDSILLSRDPHDRGDFHQRLCLRAFVQSPIGPVNFLVTHLSLSQKARNRTLPEIGQYAASLPDPSILVGDMNSVLEVENQILSTDYDFVDAWTALHPEAKPEEGWTFNSWEMKSRIDYVFVRGLHPVSISIEGTEAEVVPGLAPVGGVKDMHDRLYPSDHRFLSATIAKL